MMKDGSQLGHYKIAIVGAREEILCFSSLGVRAFSVKNGEEAAQRLYEIKKTRQDATNESSPPLYAIVFVMEDILRKIPEEDLKKLSAGALPAIISLPGHRGATGFGDLKIRRIVEKAVGSDIFAN